MRVCGVKKTGRCRRSILNYVRRHKSQGSRIISKKCEKWQVQDMSSVDFDLSPAPYNTFTHSTGLRICPSKNWRVTEMRSIDFQLSKRKVLSWRETEMSSIDFQLSPAPYNQEISATGAKPESDNDVEWQVADLNNTRRLSITQEKFEYWNDVEFNDENYETGYVPELNNGTTGSKTNDNNDEASELISGTLDSETNDTNDEVSELNGDGANSSCNNESGAKEVVINFHKKNDVLDDSSRSQLVKKLMDCIFREEMPEKPDFGKLARIICSIYTCETEEVFSNGYSGKLYHAYNKRLRQLRGDGTLPKSTRALNQMKRSEKPKTFEMTDGVQRSIDYLFEEQECYDVDDCLYHWSNTFDYRQYLMKKCDPQFLFSWGDWQPLQRSWSYILICEDFITIHGDECAQSLTSNWQSTFSEEKLNLIRDLVKDQSTKENANRLPGSEDYKNVSLVNYINAILFPSLIKRNWRGSIVQAQTSVIMMVKSIEDVQSKVVERLAFCEGKGMEAHPIIFALEPVDDEDDLNQFLVVFGGTQYKFKCFLDALDVCFKMFVSLHIPFPLESKQFYIVLNELFYKISLDMKKSTKVLTFLQKMQ